MVPYDTHTPYQIWQHHCLSTDKHSPPRNALLFLNVITFNRLRWIGRTFLKAGNADGRLSCWRPLKLAPQDRLSNLTLRSAAFVTINIVTNSFFS